MIGRIPIMELVVAGAPGDNAPMAETSAGTCVSRISIPIISFEKNHCMTKSAKGKYIVTCLVPSDDLNLDRR